MEYSSDAMKKYYRSICDKQRAKNLIRLREDIAKLSQAQFRLDVGFTKSDLSNLESGEKLLSLFHIQAYKCYFMERHNLDVSVDFLMGYTTVISNDNMKTEKEYGLSDTSIEALKLLAKMSNHVSEEICAETGFKKAYTDYISVINFVLSRDIEKLMFFLDTMFCMIHIDEFGVLTGVKDGQERIIDDAYLSREAGDYVNAIRLNRAVAKSALKAVLSDSVDALAQADEETYPL